ncbi:hypothetical protein Ddc_10250 [Ditylenchus destructor]|nr:hypothetical protein Ddc_10250 [Ditylenchus destructor]
MRRSAEQTEKQAKYENEAPGEPKAKKIRLADSTPNIATLDNGTMVEVYKYLDYCGLAKNSLVSKRFRNLIQTHRHKFALLYVDHIEMECVTMPPTAVKVFDKWLSFEEYNEWAVRNGYLLQVSLESQAGEEQNALQRTFDRKVYQLNACADYNDPTHRRIDTKTSIFFARAELNHEYWPSFQHFVRFLTAPFVCIRHIMLTSQNDVLNLLTGAMNPEHERIQCRKLTVYLEDNTQKLISWIKNHVSCYEFVQIMDNRRHDSTSNYDKELLDLFATGNRCTSAITIVINDLSTVLADFVQKFIDLKTCDENQMVESIQGNATGRVLVEVLKRNFASFILKDEADDDIDWTTIFQFNNNDVGKRMQLSIVTHSRYPASDFSMKIMNL